MHIKYIAAGVLVLCLLPAGYYSMKETPLTKPELDLETDPMLSIRQEEEPRSTAATAAAAEEHEEQRAAARIEAIEAMENANDVKTLTALGNALADPNREVKDAALQALSERTGATATEMLRRGLSDPDPEFRLEVLEALAERGDMASVRGAKSDSNEDVRQRAAELLENAGQ